MSNVVRFISREEASRILAERVDQIKVEYSHLPVDEQIDIMTDFIVNADPQIQRESTRQYWEAEDDQPA